MPLDKLIEKILEDARAQAAAIKEEARIKGERILAEADEEAGRVYRDTLENARKDAEEEKKRRVSTAVLDSQREILAEKQKLIGDVFEQAIEAIRNLPRDRYLDLMKRMLVADSGEMGGEVMLSSRDREDVGRELVDGANRIMEEKSSKVRFTLSQEARDMAGGFVVRSGGIEINDSLEWQIKSRKEELEPRLVEILFAEIEKDQTRGTVND